MSEENVQVSIGKAELEALVAQNAELIKLVKQQQDGKGEAAEFPSNRRRKEIKVTVSAVDGLPVIGMVNKGDEERPWYTWVEMDPKKPNTEILLCDLIVLDPKTGKTEVYERINWLEFLDKGGRQECTVIKQRAEEWFKENGLVTKRTVPEGDHYRMEELDIQVPDIVEGKINYYVVDYKGTPVEIHEQFINMTK